MHTTRRSIQALSGLDAPGAWAGGRLTFSQGTAKNRLDIARRFLEEEFHGEMIGQAVCRPELDGLRHTKQTFNTVWVSDTQTSMFTSEGKGANGNKVITLEGKASCPATGREGHSHENCVSRAQPGQHVLRCST